MSRAGPPKIITLVGGGSTVVAWAVDRLFPELPSLVPLTFLFVGIAMMAFGAVRWAQGERDDKALGPRELAEPLRNLVPLRDALAYCHFREWNFHLSGIDALIHYGSAASRLEGYAGNRVIEIWGRVGNNPNKFAKPIPPDAWDEQLIDRSSILTEISYTVYRETQPSYKYDTFFDLAVNWKDLEELFPPKNFRTARAWIRRWKRALTAS